MNGESPSRRGTDMTARLGSLALIGAFVGLLVSACSQPSAQGYRAPRTSTGVPDLSGIWQANNTANWDLEAHPARQGPMFALGAAFSVPPGLGVVEGGEIPYLPAALEKKKTNAANWMKLDPEVKCYMPGIRAPLTCRIHFRSSSRPTRS